MVEPKLDPRVVRTRQLIQDSFIALISEKDFKDITIGDITERATVNRATFYAHFTDKYELLDATISNDFKGTLNKNLNTPEGLNQKNLTNLFITMCHYHKDLSNLCNKNYQSLGTTIQTKIIGELQELISNLITQSAGANRNLKDDREQAKLIATILSWSLYGSTFSWNQEGRRIPAEELAVRSLPVLMKGIETALHQPR